MQDEVRIGNFVEPEKALFGIGAKAKRFTYLGGCKIGALRNIGAGTITCNNAVYKKHETVIGEYAFIGSDTCLVAPVVVEVGAAPLITKNAKKDSLTLTRTSTTVRPGW